MPSAKKDKELELHKFIVLANDHYNPLGVVRSLGEAGIYPIVILIAHRPHQINVSKYVRKLHIVETKKEGFNVLVSRYGKEKKDFIYSCSDDICEMLDEAYDSLKERFYFFHGKEQGILTKYLNKDNINNIARNYGCLVLKNEILKKGQLPSTLRYPVITKAMMSTLYSWKKEMHICNNETELLNAYKEIRSDIVLVQEFIRKKNELCLDGFSYNDGNDICIPYYTNYIRFSDLSYGGYMLLRPFEQKFIFNQIKNILREIGFNGIFSAEFLIDEEGNYWFLEINFRNSTWSYAFTYGGYNMPYLWALGTLKKNIDLSNIKPKNSFVAMAEIEDYKMMVKTGRMSFGEWLKDFFHADCYFLYNKKDPLPFWNSMSRLWANIVIRKILHIFGKRWKE